jgi:hypothetical protein
MNKQYQPIKDKKLQNWFKDTFIPLLTISAILVVIALFLFAVPYFEYRAYRERFQDAPAWTFFFQGGNK